MRVVFMGTPDFAVTVLQALIDNYDVVSNHAAYIGKFKDEMLFYMMSRGISRDSAYHLLLNGFLIQSGKMEDYIACERAKATLEDVTTNESCIKIASDKSISAALNALSKSNNETASYVKNRTARKVSDAVSVSVLENTANSVSTSVASSVASLVGNGVKEESVKSITSSLNTLYNGVSQIDSGINELSDGVSKFNDEGIQKLNNLINGDVKCSEVCIAG